MNNGTSRSDVAALVLAGGRPAGVDERRANDSVRQANDMILAEICQEEGGGVAPPNRLKMGIYYA